MFDFLVINPEFDTPANLFIAGFLMTLAIWSAIHMHMQHKRDLEEEKKQDAIF